MPLWGNPLLPAPRDQDSGGRGSTLDDKFWALHAIVSLRTIGDAHRIAVALQDARAYCSAHVLWGDTAHRYYMQHVWQPELARYQLRHMPELMRVLVADREHVHSLLLSLCAAIPPEWLQQCITASAADVAAAAPTVVLKIIQRLGWRLPPPPTAAPGTACKPAKLTQLTVKLGTLLQQGPVSAERRKQHVAYTACALELTQGNNPAPAHVRQLAATLSTAWQLKWENVEKDTLWRLAVDGIPGANSRVQFRCPSCPSAAHDDARVHAFWDCPVAAAVLNTITAAMLPEAPVLSRASIWLCRPPEHVHPGVWLIVCMAALSAMDHGRRQLWRLTKAADHQAQATARALAAQHQRTLLQSWGVQQLPAHQTATTNHAAALAVTNFWTRLASFAALGMAPAAWASQVQETHPFLCCGGLKVRMGAAAHSYGVSAHTAARATHQVTLPQAWAGQMSAP